MNEVVTLWIPSEASRALYEELTAMFCKKHPGVSFQIVDFPLTTYWDVLEEALKEQRGPDLFFMHNEHVDKLIQENVIAPYHFDSKQQQVVDALYPASSNQCYYYDFAHLTSLLYVQEGMDTTSISSWNDCIKALQNKATTPYAFGCSVNLDAAAAFLIMATLQKAGPSLKETREGHELLQRMFQSVPVFDPRIDCKDAFVAGEIQMVYSWGWFAGYLHDKGMNYQVLSLCHEADSLYYDRYNTKSSCGISAFAKQKQLAQTFVYTFLTDIEMQKKFCLTRKLVPLHAQLQQDAQIQQDAVIMAQKQSLSHAFMPKQPLQEHEIEEAMKEVYRLYETK